MYIHHMLIFFFSHTATNYYSHFCCSGHHCNAGTSLIGCFYATDIKFVYTYLMSQALKSSGTKTGCIIIDGKTYINTITIYSKKETEYN